jgi:hypothetical protein
MRSEGAAVSVGTGRRSEAGPLASIARKSLRDPWGQRARFYSDGETALIYGITL